MKTYEAYTGNGSTREITHRRPEQIEHDLSEIRAEITETLDAIQQRFSTGQLVEQFVGGLKEVGRGSSDFFVNMGRNIRDNPIPTALIGAGLAFLAWSGSRERGGLERGERRMGERAREAMTRAKERAGEAMSSTTESGQERAGEIQERMEEGRESARERLAHGKERVRHAGEELRGRMGDRAGRARALVEETWHEQPLVVGALGLALGAALGAGLRPTRTEEELLAEPAQKLRSNLEQARQEATEAASEAKERIRTSVAEKTQQGPR